MGPPGAHLSTPVGSSLLHLSQAELGLERLLHSPPSHPSVLPPCTCWRMLFAVPSPHLSQSHSSLSPNHHQQQKLQNSRQEGQWVFSRHFVSPSNEPWGHPVLLAVTILVTPSVTPSLPRCQGMFSATKVTSLPGTLFPCVLPTTDPSMAPVFGCSWQ